MSEETKKKVDSEIRKYVEKGYERARKILTEKIDDLQKFKATEFIDALLENNS